MPGVHGAAISSANWAIPSWAVIVTVPADGSSTHDATRPRNSHQSVESARRRAHTASSRPGAQYANRPSAVHTVYTPPGLANVTVVSVAGNSPSSSGSPGSISNAIRSHRVSTKPDPMSGASHTRSGVVSSHVTSVSGSSQTYADCGNRSTATRSRYGHELMGESAGNVWGVIVGTGRSNVRMASAGPVGRGRPIGGRLDGPT